MQTTKQNNLKRQQIINSAITEFGVHSYNDASLNRLSREGNFSKGIIYHYFKNKDELYLTCVSECFESLTAFLNRETISFDNVENATKTYLSLRQQFFNQHPKFSNIFANALFHPPEHLKSDIRTLKSKLDQFNYDFYEKVLQNVNLKAYVSFEEAMEYFKFFQESFNYYFQTQDDEDFEQSIQKHEIKLEKILKFMFYGIIKEETP